MNLFSQSVSEASKGEDHCEGLDIDLAFPESAAAGENKAEAA
jgi:hypothetical protein